ncbi:MAG: molecular chaperone DnaK, partial [Eubacteriaceae bacterium]|nr:molecular chaperone DnaK [Eubacteriaceae bacterium]
VEAAIADLKEKAQGDDPEVIRAAIDKVNEALYPIAQKMYEQAQAQQQAAGAQAGPDAGAAGQGGDDDVEEASYEDVTDK